MFEKFLHQTPFFRLVLPLIAGILFQINFTVLSSFIIYFLAFFFIIILILITTKLSSNYSLNKFWGIAISLFLFTCGMEMVYLKQGKESYFNNGKYVFIATLTEPIQEKENSVKTVLKLDFIKDSSSLKKEKSNVLCYFQKDSLSLNLKLGDQILAETYLNEIKPPLNPYTFDYKKYLRFKEIYSQCYIKSGHSQVVDHFQGPKLKLYSNEIRQKLLKIYTDNHISGDEFAVLSALTLGFKDELTPELKESFSTSGAMHILAVSGLHVGIIFIILSKILFFLEKKKYGQKIKSAVIILVLFFYAFLTGLSDSVLRATIMFSFISLGKMFSRQINIYNSIAASAFVLLCINPYSIMNVGFQLSYAAVISIVFFQPKIYSLFNFQKLIPDYIWQLISVAIAAQIGTFPITIFYFGQFPLYFILSNIIIIPLATIIIYGAILLFTFSFSGFISTWIAKGLNLVTHVLNQNVYFIENLPYSKLDQIPLSGIESFLFLVLVFVLSFYMITKRFQFLRLTILIGISISILSIFGNYKKSQISLFAVHSIPEISAMHFIDHQKAFFIINQEIKTDDKQIKYNIDPLWNALHVKSKTLDTFKASEVPEYFQFYKKRILRLNNNSILNSKSDQKLKINYLVLSENIQTDIKGLLELYDFDIIIFDSSNSYYTIKRWEKICIENKIKFHNVIEDGAFIAYI